MKKSPCIRKRFGIDKDLEIALEDVIFAKNSSKDEFCIFNANDYRHKKIRSQSNVAILSEADLRTYPSKKLKEQVLKHLQKVLEPWQFFAEIEKSNGSWSNIVESYYVETDYDCEDLEKRIAGNVLIGFPIKDPNFSNESIDQLLKELTSKIIRPFKLFGYDFADAKISTFENNVRSLGKNLPYVALATFQFEARNQYSDLDIHLNKYLYHITTENKLEKILKFGLNPRSSSKEFQYKDRVYLFNTSDMSKIREYAEESGKQNKDKSGNPNRRFVILQIDPSKIQNLRLYVDNMFDVTDRKNPVAVFTYKNIPASAIVNHKVLDLDVF